MSFNPYSKKVETKLYFAIFFLFASFLAVLIYNFAFDTYSGDETANYARAGFLRPHLGNLEEN